MKNRSGFILIAFAFVTLFSVSFQQGPLFAPYGIKVSATKKNNGLRSEQWSYWCPSVIRDSSGLYHMFASRFANHCGLSSWTYNSEIVHAVSIDPLGPFIEKEVVVPAMAHNPAIVKAKDGSYLLYYIGKVMDSSNVRCNCEDGKSGPSGKGKLSVWTCYIEVRRAASLNGPWGKAHRITGLLHTPTCASNPSPLIEDDGSISLYYRAYDLSAKKPDKADTNRVHVGMGEYLYKMKARKWNGLYSGSDRKVLSEPAEDAFVWHDSQGYYMVFNNKFNDKDNLGGCAYSADGKKFTPQVPIYSRLLQYDDGTSETLIRRERPGILWINEHDGVLYNGVQPARLTDKTYILAVPIRKVDH